MTEPKIVIRAVRFTFRGDTLLQNLAIACNKFNLKINGESEINPSVLLGYLYEKLSHSNEGKSDKVLQLLTLLDAKTPSGKDVDIDIIRAIIREMSP